MKDQRFAPWLLVLSGLVLVALAIPFPRAAGGDPADRAAPDATSTAPVAAPTATATPTPAATATSAGEPPRSEPLCDPSAGSAPSPTLGDIAFDPARGRYVARYGGGEAVLTLVPRLQAALEKRLADYRVPWGATVLLEPRTGRVLALAEYSQRERGRGLCFRAFAPAASIFKIITSAALLERGIGPDAEVCYHGGRHRIAKRNLADDPRRDRRCLTLASALGHSANVVFAKLADRDLSAALLRSEAERFLFNVPIPFERPVEVSTAHISDEPFELATTAAGFGPVRLSPLHGALLAAIVANGGVFVPPGIVEAVDGAVPPSRPEPRRVVDARIAEALAEMMRATVTEGTARKAFRERRHRSPLGQVAVAGKTGSLAEAQPYRDYTWFIGFAPVERPEVAVATVVANERLWRVRASSVAHEALEAYFGRDDSGPKLRVVRMGRTASR